MTGSLGVDRQEIDDEIRARLEADDAAALEMIWTHYSADLLGYLCSILCCRYDAEDVLQELFLTIPRKRKHVAGARLLKPYLFRMARNVAMNRIHRGQRVQRHLDRLADWLELAPDAGTRDPLDPPLTAALEALPEEQRTVIVLKHYREKTFREIGEMLDISENTAGSRYRYGIEKLRTLITRENEP